MELDCRRLANPAKIPRVSLMQHVSDYTRKAEVLLGFAAEEPDRVQTSLEPPRRNRPWNHLKSNRPLRTLCRRRECLRTRLRGKTTVAVKKRPPTRQDIVAVKKRPPTPAMMRRRRRRMRRIKFLEQRSLVEVPGADVSRFPADQSGGRRQAL